MVACFVALPRPIRRSKESIMASEQTRQAYTVTDRAGPKVAGVRVEKGCTLSLTPAQAEYELREGTIVPAGKSPPKAFDASPRADKMRDQAADVKASVAAAPASSGSDEAAASAGATAASASKPSS
jgi:hypothetical protein